MALAGAVQVGDNLAGGAASVQLAQPGGDVGVGVVGLGLLLHVHDYHGNVKVAHDGKHVVAGGVGEHLQDDQVHVGSAEEVAGVLCLFLGGYHAAVDDVHRGGQGLLEFGILALEFGDELRELRQVRAERDGEHADFRFGFNEHVCLLGQVGSFLNAL